MFEYMRRINSFLLAAMFSILLFSIFITHVHAEDDTSSDDSSATTTVQERVSDTTQSRMERIQQIREAAQERYQEKKDEFDTKVEKIRDQREKAVLTRLVSKFDTINGKWIEHWSNVLDRLTKILDKINTKAADATGDTSDYDEAYKDATDKIKAAQDLLQEQADNNYVFEITDEAKLGSEVSDITDQFRTDIQDTHAAVKDARDAVKTAFSEMRKLFGNAAGVSKKDTTSTATDEK